MALGKVHWARVCSERWEAAAVLGVTLLGAGLRFAALPAKSVWLDEAFSVWMAQHAPSELWEWLVRIDHHPPLYYMLLHTWLGWFGDGPGAIRSLSALLSTLAIPLFAGAARGWGRRGMGVAAALLLALSPWQVRYAQEARMYGLLVLAVAGVLFAVTHLPAHGAESTFWRSTVPWLLLAISQAAAMLAHNTTAVLLPLSLNVGVGAAWLWARRARPQGAPGPVARGFVGRWLAAQAAATAIWALWARGFWRQAQVVDQGFWVQPPTWNSMFDYARLLAGGFLPDGGVWGGLAVALAFGLAGYGLVTWRSAPGRVWIAAALLLMPPLVEALVSLRRPIFHLPSLIWTSLPFYLLVAAGWTALARSRRRLAAGAAVGLLALSGLGLRGYYVDFEKERWDLAAAHVTAAASPGDLVLFNATWVQLPFAYYLRETDVPLELRGVPVDLFGRGELEPAMTEADLERLSALVDGRDAVWLVYSHNWYTDPQGLIPAALERRYAEVERFSLPEIQIMRFSGPRADVLDPGSGSHYTERDGLLRGWPAAVRMNP